MAYYCTKNNKVCEFANQNGYCSITACAKIAELMKPNKNNTVLSDTSFLYTKTFEEEMEEKKKVNIAENYLEDLHDNTYDTLLDLIEYLSKKNK